MKQETFKFDNGSLILEIENKKLSLTIQAKHANSLKYTSAKIVADDKTTKEILTWLREIENDMG